MNDKKEFVAYLQKKYKDLSEEKLKLLQESGLLEKDYKEFLKSKKLKALHGAKLNYIKSLKNQCAEDEELYYYKKGGRVGCGCKKKENGGEIEKAQKGTVVSKFKLKWTNKDEKKLDSLSTREAKKQPLTPQGKKDLKNLREKFKKSSNQKDYEVEEGKKGMKVEKDCGGAVTKFKAKCGSKLKKHQLGGSLNGIPFMQKGNSFKEAHKKARANKQRYFNWTDDKGVTRMYNSKLSLNDTEYDSFIDNMNEMSALLPTDRSPKHLGWDRNNSLSNELRGDDRVIKNRGTDNILREVYVYGKKPLNVKINNRIKIGDKIYSRGIAQSFPGYQNNQDGLYLRGNKIYKKSLLNGKYVDQEVGVIYKGQQYYDDSVYGRKNGRFTTLTDNDNVVTYDEYRNRLSGASKNKFMGNEAMGESTSVPRELPYTKDMNNVLWFRNYKFK